MKHTFISLIWLHLIVSIISGHDQKESLTAQISDAVADGIQNHQRKLHGISSYFGRSYNYDNEKDRDKDGYYPSVWRKYRKKKGGKSESKRGGKGKSESKRGGKGKSESKRGGRGKSESKRGRGKSSKSKRSFSFSLSRSRSRSKSGKKGIYPGDGRPKYGGGYARRDYPRFDRDVEDRFDDRDDRDDDDRDDDRDDDIFDDRDDRDDGDDDRFDDDDDGDDDRFDDARVGSLRFDGDDDDDGDDDRFDDRDDRDDGDDNDDDGDDDGEDDDDDDRFQLREIRFERGGNAKTVSSAQIIDHHLTSSAASTEAASSIFYAKSSFYILLSILVINIMAILYFTIYKNQKCPTKFPTIFEQEIIGKTLSDDTDFIGDDIDINNDNDDDTERESSQY